MTADPRIEIAARALVKALDDLICDSSGVYGLHLNGEVAPWGTLLEGGQFEEWLLPLSEMKEALDAARPEVEADDIAKILFAYWKPIKGFGKPLTFDQLSPDAPLHLAALEIKRALIAARAMEKPRHDP